MSACEQRCGPRQVVPFNIDPATAWIKASRVDRHNRRSRNTREKHPVQHEMPAYQPVYFDIDVSLRCKLAQSPQFACATLDPHRGVR
jgi:hypothetical protein